MPAPAPEQLIQIGPSAPGGEPNAQVKEWLALFAEDGWQVLEVEERGNGSPLAIYRFGRAPRKARKPLAGAARGVAQGNS